MIILNSKVFQEEPRSRSSKCRREGSKTRSCPPRASRVWELRGAKALGFVGLGAARIKVLGFQGFVNVIFGVRLLLQSRKQ